MGRMVDGRSGSGRWMTGKGWLPRGEAAWPVCVDALKPFLDNSAMGHRHPDKHIDEVVRHAESLGWRVTLSEGHAWGLLWCPEESREGCRLSVFSTPRVPEHHARWLRKMIDRCPHRQGVRDGNGA